MTKRLLLPLLGVVLTFGVAFPAGARRLVDPLPKGPVTIVTLGDSLTEGSGDDRGIGYPGRLIKLVDKLPGRSGSTIVNLGKSGWQSEDLVKGHDSEPSQLAGAKDAIAAAQARGESVIATVLIGSNDLWYAYEYGPEGGTRASDENAVLRTYRKNLDKIVRTLTGAGATVGVGLPDDQSKRPVAADAKKLKETFPSITTAEVARMSKLSKKFDSAARKVAARYEAIVVDLRSPVFTTPSLLSDDGNHPNGKGYDQLTRTWFEALEPILAQ